MLQEDQKIEDEEKYYVKFFDWVGGILTTGAMIPQGILGFLMTDTILTGFGLQNLYVRTVANSIMFFTAEEGKRRLVRFYNTEGFKNLGRPKFWKDFFNPSNWGWEDTINFPGNISISIIASSTFAYITKLSLNGISGLLSKYNTKATDYLSRELLKNYVQYPLMASSFICNMFGFPFIHISFSKLLEELYLYAIENPEFRKIRNLLKEDIEATRLIIKKLYENENIIFVDNGVPMIVNKNGSGLTNEQENFNEVLRGIHQTINSTVYNSEEEKINALREYLIQNMPDTKQFPRLIETWPEFFHKNLMGILMSFITVWGFMNFLQMGAGAALMVGGLLGGGMPAWLITTFGITTYFSLIALGVNSTYNLGRNFMEWCFGRDVPINIFSNARNIWIIGLVSTVCLLGGAPNAYQNILAHGSIPEEIVSFLASTFTEAMGMYLLTKHNHIKEVIKERHGCCQSEKYKKSPPINIYKLDEFLRKTSDFRNSLDNEINYLYNQRPKEIKESNHRQAAERLPTIENYMTDDKDDITINIPVEKVIPKYRSSYYSIGNLATSARNAAKSASSYCCSFWKSPQEEKEPLLAENFIENPQSKMSFS